VGSVSQIHGPVGVGKIMWFYPAGDYVNSSPVVAGDTVYVGSDDHYLYALSTQVPAAAANSSTPIMGTLKWRFDCGGVQPYGSVYSPIVVGSVVYVLNDEGKLYALNAETGEKIWNQTITTRASSSYTTPSYSNGIIYIPGNDTLHAINTADGSEVWSFTSPYPIYANPTVASGVVYVGCNDNVLYSLNASSGIEIEQFTIGVAPIVASPSIVNGVLYIGTSYGSIYALGAIQDSDVLAQPMLPTPSPPPTSTPTPNTYSSTPTPTQTSASSTATKQQATSTPTPQQTPTATPTPNAEASTSTQPTVNTGPQPPPPISAPIWILGGIGLSAVVIGGFGAFLYRKKLNGLQRQKHAD